MGELSNDTTQPVAEICVVRRYSFSAEDRIKKYAVCLQIWVIFFPLVEVVNYICMLHLPVDVLKIISLASNVVTHA